MLFYQADVTTLNRRNHRKIWFLDNSEYSRGAILPLNDILPYGHPLVLIYDFRF